MSNGRFSGFRGDHSRHTVLGVEGRDKMHDEPLSTWAIYHTIRERNSLWPQNDSLSSVVMRRA